MVGGEHLVEVEDRLDAAVVRRAERRPVVARARRDDRLDGAMGGRSGRVELAGDEVLATHAVAERGPELRLERADRDPAVGAAIRPVADERAAELEPAPPRD